MFRLPPVRYDADKVDGIGDKMAAALFFVGASWYPKTTIVYPDADVWCGFVLLVNDNEFGPYIKYLNSGQNSALDTPPPDC